MTKFKLLFTWLYTERKVIRSIYALSFVQGLMYLMIPLGIQAIVTFVMAGSFSTSLVVLCVLTTILVAFIGFFQLWQMRITETLQEKIFGNIASKISYYLHGTKSNDTVLFKINKYFELVTLQKGISKILLDFSFSFISIIFGLILLPAYSSWFLVFTILLGGVFYFIVNYYGKRALETNLKTSNSKYELMDWFQKSVISDKTSNDDFIGHTDHILSNYFANRKQYYNTLETQFKGIIIFKIIFISILLFLGAFLVQTGELNIGQFIASEIIIFLVINSVEKFVSSLGTSYDMVTSLYKIETMFGKEDGSSFVRNETHKLKSFSNIYTHPYSKRLKQFLVVMVVLGLINLFLPWTQNVESVGKITSLDPANRPQLITSRIAGRIEKWFVREGDFVKKNDTIAFISEVKDEYIDPLLIDRSEQQVKAKETTLQSYEQKINAINSQIDALGKVLNMKLQQNSNKISQVKQKVIIDSIEYVSAANNYKVADEQFKRYEELVVKGVVSKTELENRKVKLQEALAKKISSESKYSNAKSELLNTEIDMNTVKQDYAEKLMKAESDKFSALSLFYEGEGSLSKLQNQLANYNMRKSYYYVTAPQDGYITKSNINGIGEIVKEGGPLCNFVPKQNDQAVELYINPIDLPLIKEGQRVQLIFDGWPAFVFSGWPGVSYGSYTAEVVAYDKVISDNGKFRILAKNAGKPWPDALQIGGGVKGFALLNDVPLVYEFWRQINGFPPDFYKNNNTSKKNEKKKE